MSAPRDVTRWWKKPRKWGRQGWIAAVAGADEHIACPQCGVHPVVYNGNYFCDNWNHPVGPNDCGWAMGSPARSERDRAVCVLLGINPS